LEGGFCARGFCPFPQINIEMAFEEESRKGENKKEEN